MKKIFLVLGLGSVLIFFSSPVLAYTIRVSVTQGSNPVTDSINVNCNLQVSPWTSTQVTTSTGGVYDCAVDNPGTYTVGANCKTWPCSYGGYPSTPVTVAAGDTVVNASLSFTLLDKFIDVTLQAGDSVICDNMSVNCNEMGGAWTNATANSCTGQVYRLSVGTGTYNCMAHCNSMSCDVSGGCAQSVTMADSDTTKTLTLNFSTNNSTLSGVVTAAGSPVANAWVSINNFKSTATGGGGDTAGLGGGNTANACSSSQTNVSAQTGADGAFTATAPAGTYTVAVWPPYDRRDIASVSTEVTLTSNTTQVVTLEMPVKNATISGRLVDANGAAVTGWINGWHRQNSAGSSDWFSAQADNDGYYTAYAVDGLVYNLTANANTWGDAEDSTICTYTTEGAQTVEASAAADQTVNFTFPLCDCPMQVNLTNEDGDILTQLYAGAQASPESSGDTAEGGAAFRGNWASLNGGTGTMQVEEGVELSYDAWFWDEDYIPGDPVTATCSGDGGVVNLVAETVIEDAVSGGYVDAAGSAITLDGYTWLSVYASRGRQHRPCNVTSSGYSCDLSAGSWKLGHWINPESGYASGVGSSSLVVSDSGGLSEDLTLLRVGSIDVTVTNTDGSPRGDVFVQANPYSGSEEGGFSGYFYSPDACYTGSDGICTIKVGAAPVGTTYYLTAHIPFSMQTEENIFNPEEVAVTVTEGGTTAAALSFVEPDGSFDVVVTEGTPAPEAESVSPVANATVDCFALEGFNFSEGVDDESGLVGCPCMTGIVWYAVAYGMVGSNLYMSAVTETECAADSTTSIQLALDYVVTVPESQSATISDISSQTLTLTMEDGFKVVFPQTSLGSAGQATCTADAAVTPFTSNKRPVSFYGYTVACFDGNGVAITDLDADATFVLPYNATQVANLELEEDQLESNYFDTSAGAYSFITTAAVDTEGDSVTFTQDHLTDFALLGNGVLAGANGEDGTSGTDDGGDDGSAAEGGSGCGCWMGDDFSGAPRNGSAGRRSSAVPLVLMVLIGIAYVRRRRRI